MEDKMKINFALITLGFLSISCERQTNPLSFTFDFVFNFPTEPRPNAIAVDKDTGYIYVSNSHPYRNNDNRKIQKYNRKGEFSKTIVDFTTFDKGNYTRYEPIDMTIMAVILRNSILHARIVRLFMGVNSILRNVFGFMQHA
jgi:hypothetical protein